MLQHFFLITKARDTFKRKFKPIQSAFNVESMHLLSSTHRFILLNLFFLILTKGNLTLFAAQITFSPTLYIVLTFPGIYTLLSFKNKVAQNFDLDLNHVLFHHASFAISLSDYFASPVCKLYPYSMHKHVSAE